jgi:hypothetical protein
MEASMSGFSSTRKGYIFSKWQSEKTRIPGTLTSLSQEEVQQVVSAVLPGLPADVQLEAHDCMTGKSETLSRRANVVLQFAVTAYVSAKKR